ncbi:hypothetical protein CDD83_2478 [Cordyceps sp. RAO-2017]|nr:hypothetical protein CDD83_2478 [Cordyceps sp. RAO-2017]
MHKWIHGRRGEPSREQKLRVLGAIPLNFTFVGLDASKREFPRVDVVTGLHLRRQYYRSFNHSSIQMLLRQSFPRLEELRIESWHVICREPFELGEREARTMVENLPPTLRSVHLFEDFNHTLHPDRHRRIALPTLGHRLCDASHNLTSLSAAFLVDAWDFFTRFEEHGAEAGASWPNLRTLSLTSRHFRRLGASAERLLEKAGTGAMAMPRLEAMELWTSGEGEARVFQFQARGPGGRGPRALWWAERGGGPRLNPSGQCRAAWTGVFRRSARPGQARPEFDLQQRWLPEYVSGSDEHATLLRHLVLGREMLHPLSYYQLMWEGDHEGHG